MVGGNPDAAARHRTRAADERGLFEDDDAEAARCRAQRRGERGAARSDHEEIGLKLIRLDHSAPHVDAALYAREDNA